MDCRKNIMIIVSRTKKLLPIEVAFQAAIPIYFHIRNQVKRLSAHEFALFKPCYYRAEVITVNKNIIPKLTLTLTESALLVKLFYQYSDSAVIALENFGSLKGLRKVFSLIGTKKPDCEIRSNEIIGRSAKRRTKAYLSTYSV